MFFSVKKHIVVLSYSGRHVLYDIKNDLFFKITSKCLDMLKVFKESPIDTKNTSIDPLIVNDLLNNNIIYKSNKFVPHDIFDESLVKIKTEKSFKKKPKKATIYITKQCPLNCTHCAVSAWKKWPMELSDDEWMRAINQLALKKFDLFQISWWEPFIRKNLIIDILDKFWNKFKNIVINTNALLVDDEILDYLEKYKVIVYVSIYWSNSELYKSVTWFDLFDKADKWIKKLCKRNIDVRASVPMISSYLKHINEINDYIHSFGINRIAYMWLIPAWRAKDNMKTLITEKRSEYLPRMYKYCWESEVMFDNVTKTIIDIPCHSYSVRVSIDNQWSVYPCEFLPIYLWNIRDQSISQIIKSPNAHYCYHDLDVNSITLCNKCVYKYACKAICPSMTYSATGNYLNPPPTCSIATNKFYKKLKDNNLFWE